MPGRSGGRANSVAGAGTAEGDSLAEWLLLLLLMPRCDWHGDALCDAGLVVVENGDAGVVGTEEGAGEGEMTMLGDSCCSKGTLEGRYADSRTPSPPALLLAAGGKASKLATSGRNTVEGVLGCAVSGNTTLRGGKCGASCVPPSLPLLLLPAGVGLPLLSTLACCSMLSASAAAPNSR